ncbi:MAG: lactate racemase domain-containing protein [Eubacteriales bacterium]|nr:lactate racemase domain-containing protein [Eubacteriales bacterium]
MEEFALKAKTEKGISKKELRDNLRASLKDKGVLKKVLIIPPDYTRLHSEAGKITAIYYELLKGSCEIDIMPALGTHDPMTEVEIREMYGDGIPLDRFIVHNWKTDVIKVGEVPAEFINKVSEGLINNCISVELNKRILDPLYDLIISIGQVVPHEVAGMANYSKNIFVGCGGNSMINSSHMLGAFYGMERIMGRDFSPVRKVFDYAEENYLKNVPIMYVLTVNTADEDRIIMHGLFIGRARRLFEGAVALSQENNLIHVDAPFKKVVVNLDEKEFKSTWLGNKSIYRTRMAIADGGELIVLAPGVRKFGEDNENDRLIRKYGYVGRERILELVREQEDLQQNLSVAAHLIHGSSDGRFSITYAVKSISKEEIENANFKYMPFDEAVTRYDPKKLTDGWNTLPDGEEIFYISNPALGLWIA